MSHGLRIVNNGQRYQANLLDGVEVVVSAVLTDWYFGVASGVLSGVGNIPSGSAFGSPGLTPNLTIVGIAGAELFGSPTVSTSALLTNVGGLASAEAIGSPGVSAGLSPGAIVSGEVVGQPSAAATVGATGISSAVAFGSPALLWTILLTGVGAIASEGAFGSPGVLVSLSPAGILSEELFGSPEVTVPYVVSPYGVYSGESFGTPVVTIVYVITGVVKDKQGKPVPGADVNLFNAATHLLVHNGVSDSAGRYSVVVPDGTSDHFMVAFFGSNPRRAGCTLDNLRGK